MTTRLHIADGYDPWVYDMTFDDFAEAASAPEYAPGRHTWVVTVFYVSAPDTYSRVTGCLAGCDGTRLTVQPRYGDPVKVTPWSVHVLGDACEGHAS